MLKQLFTFMFCSMMLPGAMATDIINVSQNTAIVADDDDDDDKIEKRREKQITITQPEISCTNISRKSADVTVLIRARNNTNNRITGIVAFEIEDEKGNTVAIVNDKVMIPANIAIVSKNTVTLKDPHLYSAERSYRYELEAEVLDYNGEEISNEKEVKFVIAKGKTVMRDNARRNAARRHPGNNLKNNSSNLKLEKTAR